MSRRIQPVERRCAAGLAGAHTGLQDRILLNYTTGLSTCLHQKKPSNTFEAYTHKTWTTTHKIDIKTRQNHRYNTSPIFFYFQKSQNFKIWLQNIQIGNPAAQDLRMRIKYVRKLSIFKSRKLSFPFPLLRHYEMPECLYVKNCCF